MEIFGIFRYTALRVIDLIGYNGSDQSLMAPELHHWDVTARRNSPVLQKRIRRTSILAEMISEFTATLKIETVARV